MREPQLEPLDRDRLSVLLAVLVLGQVLFQFIELPGQVYRFRALGSPLEIHASGTLLLTTLMIGLASTGTSVVLHDHPLLREHPERSVALCWILPATLAGLWTYGLSLAPTLPIWLAGLVMFGVSVGLTVSAEYAAAHPDAPRYATVRLALNVLAYLMAFALFVITYQTRTRSLVTATFTLFVAAVLAIDLLTVGDVEVRRALLFAAIIGLIIGESTWALNYWQISAWVGGLLLLLVFYVSVNVAHQDMMGRLSTATLVELAAVTLAVLLVILIQYT